MNGLNLQFKCPVCKRNIDLAVSGAALYKINGLLGTVYVRFDCTCGNTMFVDTENHQEADTLEEKRQAFNRLANLVGTKETTFNRLIQKGYFIPKGTKVILLTSETKVEPAGVAMF